MDGNKEEGKPGGGKMHGIEKKRTKIGRNSEVEGVIMVEVER